MRKNLNMRCDLTIEAPNLAQNIFLHNCNIPLYFLSQCVKTMQKCRYIFLKNTDTTKMCVYAVDFYFVCGMEAKVYITANKQLQHEPNICVTRKRLMLIGSTTNPNGFAGVNVMPTCEKSLCPLSIHRARS